MMQECFCDSHADHLWTPAAHRPLAATASPPSYVCRGEAEGGRRTGGGWGGGGGRSCSTPDKTASFIGSAERHSCNELFN